MQIQLSSDPKNVVNSEDYTSFIVTGKTTDNKRFSRTFNTNQVRYAFSINLWSGSVWGVRKSNGKRHLLNRVY